jgi:hypothetical protein
LIHAIKCGRFLKQTLDFFHIVKRVRGRRLCTV